ncbi:MAG: hypothetical protein JST61_08745 [Acidobacteria bacterium]|nr:hypothetical protein [Acidobacteriota bacterium]
MSSARAWLTILFSTLLLCAAPGNSQTMETPQADAGPATVAPAQAKTLTNASIIRMVGANLSDDLILQAIASQPGKYSTDADALVDLKDAGVSERVIAAMVNKGRKHLTAGGTATDDPPPPPVSLPLVNEMGVYYKDRKGAWQPLSVEVVHSRSSGWIKSTVTQGIIKQDMNGHLNGRESKLPLQAPIEILIYTPEGVDAAEYTFLRFHVHSNSREFRTLTGGIFHSSGGAGHDEVEFHASKIAPRTYQFTIDHSVGGGEFGILPPGTGNITNGGKIYTFAITE